MVPLAHKFMRLDHWEISLDKLIAERLDAPFEYGAHDCCLFAADAVLAITGIDIASPDYRGKYNDAASAFALIETITGGTTVEDAMDHAMQSHEFVTALPSVLYAQRGDIVSCVRGEGIMLGVVGLSGTSAWLTDVDGLKKIPVQQCKRAWHIG